MSDLGGMQNNPDTGDSYVPTGSSAVYLPGRDYSNGAPGVPWISEQRTNLVTYSNDFTRWANVWGGGATLTPNQLTGPDGNISLHKLARIDANNDGLKFSTTLSASKTYSASVIFSAGTSNKSRLLIYDDNAAALLANLEFNWTSGVPSTSASFGASNIKYEALGNGLYRVSFSFTTAATVTTHSFVIIPESNGIGTEYCFIGFAQLEEGSTPSPYIPTNGSAVTRNADDLTQLLSNIPGWNASEGAMVVKWGADADANQRAAAISDGSNTNRLEIARNSSNALLALVYEASTAQAYLTLATDATSGPFKEAMAWKANDFAGSVNGAAVVNDAAGTVPTGLTTAYLGASAAGVDHTNGHLHSVALYPKRLSNSDLQSMSV